MKTITKIGLVVAASVLLVFSIYACKLEDDDYNVIPITAAYNVGQTMVFSNHQTWERNYETIYLSQVHHRYGGNHEVKAVVFIPDGSPSPVSFTVGSGTIRNGILNFNVQRLQEEHFLPMNYIDLIFGEWVYESEGVEYTVPLVVSPGNLRGNIVTLFTTDDDVLSLELFSGTQTSLSGEFIWFVYAETAGTVTSPQRTKSPYNIYEALNLTLRPGWNMIRRKETYTDIGVSYYNLSIVQSVNYLRWAVVDIDLEPDISGKLDDLRVRVFGNNEP